ncbi:response regulator [Massilia sp. TS11]|uniref:response regulator n=1 Tax=Massilia sp. TS11 TaxID=2908003 RepID=UPI001EDBF499|nr:response regulator [Massilia sp. TS11]MCG2583109.1 response regulator [Massilia sp. TS11]
MNRILIVEDEPELAGVVADYLGLAGYLPQVIGDGAEAWTALRTRLPDLIVLDLMLPGMDGLALCRAVRAFSDVPIIMVTARVEEVDRLLGLEAGADDYLCKPFSPRELVARVKAILRRSQGSEGASKIRIDHGARRVWCNRQELELTPSEFAILAAMAAHRGQVFSRARLLEIASADNLDVTDRAVDSHIKNLRKKLDAALPGVQAIHAIYGLGYRFDL